ncbi:HIT domain-containing protein [Polaromonas sp.]|nr:HIT domain-containing protein [Candidatus Saccharibacteria bacterium]
MFHYQKTKKRLSSFPKPTGCPFCENLRLEKITEETEFHLVVPNRVKYDVWELRRVIDHLLVVPKRHVLSLAELTKAEKLDHMNIVSKYESKGYNVYARGVGSGQRSVAHQHTHLIKTVTKQARGSLTIRKPYIFKTF